MARVNGQFKYDPAHLEITPGQPTIVFVRRWLLGMCFFFFFQAEDGIRDFHVTGVQTCALPISESFKLGGTRGALIAGVLRGGPADKAGIRPGDVLLEVQGKPVADPAAMLNRSEERRVGKEWRSRGAADH